MISDRIKEERKLAGYSQEEVADYLGIDRSTYTYYESGKIKVPLDVIERIASFFGISKTFYYEFPPLNLEFQRENYFEMTQEQKDRFEEEKKNARTIVNFSNDDPNNSSGNESNAGLTQDERYLLAKIRLLDKAGMKWKVRDFLDDLLDSPPESFND